MNDYTVILKVTGPLPVSITADNLEEAKKKAIEQGLKTDFGELLNFDVEVHDVFKENQNNIEEEIDI